MVSKHKLFNEGVRDEELMALSEYLVSRKLLVADVRALVTFYLDDLNDTIALKGIQELLESKK